LPGGGVTCSYRACFRASLRVFFVLVLSEAVLSETVLVLDDCLNFGSIKNADDALAVSTDPKERQAIERRGDELLLYAEGIYWFTVEFQKTYFVIRQFDLLGSITPERIVKLAKIFAKLPNFSWRDLVPGDRVLQVGESAVSTNEKYLRLAFHSFDTHCDQGEFTQAIRPLDIE